jgi:spore coat polysaccharide biosynthesis predicted glycosyltransferase SpsG
MSDPASIIPLRVVYRAEGSRHVGTGHVLRAVRVINAMQAIAPVDVVLALSGDSVGQTLAEGCAGRVMVVGGDSADGGKPVFDPRTLAPVAEFGPYDLAVVDMLDTPGGALKAVRSLARSVVTMDDRGEGRRCADAIVNVLVREPDTCGLPQGVSVFEGPEYATLDSVYADPVPSRRIGPVGPEGCRVVVTLGGADAAALSVKVAESLVGVQGIRSVLFICGMGSGTVDALHAVTATAPWEVHVVRRIPNLRQALLEADVAVVAGGLTMHEACCVGTPSLAVCQPIDHQIELAEWFHAHGAMDTVGDGTCARPELIRDAMTELLRDVNRRRMMSERGRALVDGRGAERTARVLLALCGRFSRTEMKA